ncbi:ATP-binding protein [Magnetovibrio blakemorei]|uniref:Anti-sigma regulatory factor n=1 Tax=Magnetovibrio blakemorei TaxID=28181 RepID=A0A1E5Q2W0_9PROT|nr:ATP-binding protein [Magnetovibrio blakemorei]OEJ63801.1 anti-sigma regulatory factor [Magnetovibrio blakemorei]
MKDVWRVLDIKTDEDVLRARQAGRDLAREMGLGTADQTRLATAISELTRNVLKYAGEGICSIVAEDELKTHRINVKVEDHGPGIPDIDSALEQGFTTGGGLGAGLPGTRRLVDVFNIQSCPGSTVVSISMIRPK